jgi:uncharacterized protein YdeI (YjbR/CyaY-like superfamily)
MDSKQDKIEAFFKKDTPFKSQINKIRSVLKETEFIETLKWGIPTYTINGKNVAGIGVFKNHYGLWFFQGAFLKDEKGLLRNAQEGTTKGMRQLNFTLEDELPLADIKSYALEAIKNQKDGKEIKIAKAPKAKDTVFPDELTTAFSKDKDFQNAFKALTPGRQKEYAQHIGSAKQERTRINRLEKAKPLILDGKGLHDKYKNC